jgi:hypothetical protein
MKRITGVYHLLTYMATIDSLVGTELVRITVPLGPGEGEPIREIFGIPLVADWMTNAVPKMQTERGAARTPEEELDGLLFNFISSNGRIRYGRTFKDLMPSSSEVWELITWQLRIFGWFYRRDLFIAVVPKRAVEVKRASLGYHDAISKVLEVRDRLSLDEPKFVGGHISNVVTGI